MISMVVSDMPPLPPHRERDTAHAAAHAAALAAAVLDIFTLLVFLVVAHDVSGQEWAAGLDQAAAGFGCLLAPWPRQEQDASAGRRIGS